MAAPKGNEYYLLRSKDGRDTTYTPETLLEAANEYFNWCLDNPLKESQVVKYKDSYEIIEVPKMRTFSIQGFCNYAEIMKQTFFNYEKREDFLDVTTRIRGVIENFQFEGAASGFLNPNIIARKLGLADKTELKTSIKTAKYVNATRS